MAYAVKYIAEFDSLIPAITGYKVELLFKDYVGGVTRLTGAGTPVLIKCSEDTPNAPIKGFSATFTYINQNNAYPISNFYSTADNEIKMRVSYGTQVIFEGFLVQDDFTEILTDQNHEVTLSANDNLGLLKDVLFNTAAAALSIPITDRISIKTFLSICLQSTNLELETNICEEVYTFPQPYTEVASLTAVAAQNKFFTTLIASHYQVGQVITISGSLFNNGTYTITNIDNSYFLNCTVTGTVTDETNTGGVSFATSVSYYWLDTLINPNTFYKDDATYESCYDVLYRILDRFRATLFQANGQWNIIGWDEMRYYTSYAIPSRVYDYQFVPIGSGTLGQPVTIGYGQTTYPEYGVSTRPFRPYKYTKETFNYRQPANLLKNADLQTLGTLITQYTYLTQTIKEYEFTGWSNNWPGTAITRFIRVIYNSIGEEIDRYVVLRGATGDSPRAVQADPIEVNEGDRVTFSFTVRTSQSIPGSSTAQFALRLYDGTTNRYVDDVYTGDTNWIAGLGYSVTVDASDNFDNEHTVTIESSPIPFSGLLYCYLRKVCTNDTDETIYKDLSFTYYPYVNGGRKIIGQTHQSTQATDTKNKNEKEVYIDSVTANSIQGCIFKPQTSGLLQVRTNAWRRGHMTEAWKLGEITTFEHLFWKRITRRIIDGNFRTLLQSGAHLSMAAPVEYSGFPGLIFVWGLFTMDLKRSTVTGTLYEFPNSTEIDINLVWEYEFKYLYETK